MAANEFYSMYEKQRVKVDPATINIVEHTRTTKSGSESIRYQAVATDDQGRKLYKFVNAEFARRVRA